MADNNELMIGWTILTDYFWCKIESKHCVPASLCFTKPAAI